MAGKSVSLFDDDKKAAVPSYMSDFGEKNIEDKLSLPSLTFEGKVWTIGMEGQKTKLTRKDEDGDAVPISIMRVVILNQNARRGRAYYEGVYDPAKQGAPICHSEDGIDAHPSVPDSKCPSATRKCAQCPMAVKGSGTGTGDKKVAACSQHRILVVVPANKLDFPALRMKIAVTSDYDEQNEAQAAKKWFAFTQYKEELRVRGVQHTGQVVTKMKFDNDAAYPKLLFNAERWLTEEELDVVKARWKTEEVTKLLTTNYGPAQDAPALPAPEKKKAKPIEDDDADDALDEVVTKKAKLKAKPVEDDDDGEEETAPPKKAAAKAKPADDDDEDDIPTHLDRRKSKPKPKVDDDDEEADDDGVLPEKPKAAAKKAKPVDDDEDEEPAPKSSAKKSNGKASLDDLLADWG